MTVTAVNYPMHGFAGQLKVRVVCKVSKTVDSGFRGSFAGLFKSIQTRAASPMGNSATKTPEEDTKKKSGRELADALQLRYKDSPKLKRLGEVSQAEVDAAIRLMDKSKPREERLVENNTNMYVPSRANFTTVMPMGGSCNKKKKKKKKKKNLRKT
jgi:hypothetical protein